MKKALIWIVVIILIILGGYMYMNQSKTASTDTMQGADDGYSNETDQEPNIVSYSDEGFTPKITAIQAGETVEFMNSSSKDLHIGFGEHLDHSEYPDKKMHVMLSTQGAYTDIITFPTAGTYEYHNHLNDAHSGTVVVE